MTQCEPQCFLLCSLRACKMSCIHISCQFFFFFYFVNSFSFSFSFFLTSFVAWDSIWSQWTIYIPRNDTMCQFQFFLGCRMMQPRKWRRSHGKTWEKNWAVYFHLCFAWLFCDHFCCVYFPLSSHFSMNVVTLILAESKINKQSSQWPVNSRVETST